jgi:tetratricopeptide (TPR) repeat protein
MAGTDDSKQREELEGQVWSAIAAFEQIVETIPNDRVSLEALSHAYEQVGDLARSRDYLVRLANVVVDEKDRDAADLLRERLVRYAASDEKVRQAEARIEAYLASGQPEAKVITLVEEASLAAQKRKTAGESDRSTSHVAAELSFAWTLFQAGELSQEEYATVAQDLSETSAGHANVTVSVLHVLQDRGNRNVERIVAFAARETGTPMIPLSLFDVQDGALSLLPMDFVTRHSAIAFEIMGNDVLVAVLNPYNKAMRRKVETIIGRTCHYFLTLPAEYDAVLERITKRATGATP